MGNTYRRFTAHSSVSLDGQRQGEGEGAALAFLALGPDAAAVGLDDALRDGETKPGARDLAGGLALHAVELVEDMGQVSGRDADARVGQADDHRRGRCARGVSGVAHRDGDRYRAAG